MFDTLVVFLESPGRLLTKDELLQAIWPGTVEEANLTVNVSTLRRLLADGHAPPCTETVTRRGYRFVLGAEVDRDAAPPSADARTDKPASARAQELYARANQAPYEADHWETARDLCGACVEAASDFAPAWARLARCHRLIAKYTVVPALRGAERARAIAAFGRALTLDPSLPLTTTSTRSWKSTSAARSTPRSDLCGWSSVTAPTQRRSPVSCTRCAFAACSMPRATPMTAPARSIRPSSPASPIPAGCIGDYETALRETDGDIDYPAGLTLASMGRTADAVATLRWRERDTRDTRVRAFLISLRALLEGDRDESLATLARAADQLTDPEARYYLARSYAHFGVAGAALAVTPGGGRRRLRLRSRDDDRHLARLDQT